MADYPEVEVTEVKDRVSQGAVLVDVREQDEYDEEHIPGAQFLPLSELQARYEGELPKDKDLLLQCRSGGRSGKATEFLRAQGYNALNVKGGILQWKAEGFETE